MTRYEGTDWKNRIVDARGNVIQQGTPMTAENLNKIEQGIKKTSEDIDAVTQQLTEIEIGASTQLNNTLTSASTTEALTAAKGKELNDKLLEFEEAVTAHLAQTGALTNLQTTDKTSLVNAINETFTQVVDGKNLIATAINDKGGAASSSDTFADLASAIGGIQTLPEFMPGDDLFQAVPITTSLISTKLPTITNITSPMTIKEDCSFRLKTDLKTTNSAISTYLYVYKNNQLIHESSHHGTNTEKTVSLDITAQVGDTIQLKGAVQNYASYSNTLTINSIGIYYQNPYNDVI